MSDKVQKLENKIEELEGKLKEALAINNSTEEKDQSIETLRQKLVVATTDGTDAKTELDAVMKEIEAVKKWNSAHNMKVAGAVVGMIVVVAGIAYVVRRVLANGEAEVEAVDEAAPELSVVNY